MSPRLFTIFGGTGFLGRRVVRHLADAGHRVRIAARHPERAGSLLDRETVEPAVADLLRPESLGAPLRGADGVLNAASLYRETGDATFEAFHVEAAARLAGEARRAGAARFVQISGIGADPVARDPYIAARGRGEDAVRAAFPQAAVVRPSVMFGPDDALLSTVIETARRSPVYPLFGRGQTRLQPVHVDDVATACAALLQAGTVAPLYEFGGARVARYRDLVLAITDEVGLRTQVVPVPFALWRMLAAMASPLSDPPITRSQVALMETDNVPSPDVPGLRSLGIVPRDIIAFAAQRATSDREGRPARPTGGS